MHIYGAVIFVLATGSYLHAYFYILPSHFHISAKYRDFMHIYEVAIFVFATGSYLHAYSYILLTRFLALAKY